MITLLAESKTMIDSNESLQSSFRKPLFIEEAARIMESISTAPLPELQDRLHLTPGLAVRTQKMALSFSVDEGYEAIRSYTGEVFKALDFNTLGESDRNFFKEHFRFISSLYGYLTPDDSVLPYRLNYDSCPPYPGESLGLFWKRNCTLALGKDIKDNGEEFLINLLPGDAAKYIDWKLIKGMCRVIVPVIKEIDAGGKEKTPPAGKLKKIRGLLCRSISMNHITRPDDFLNMELPEVIFSGTFLYPDYPVFYC